MTDLLVSTINSEPVRSASREADSLAALAILGADGVLDNPDAVTFSAHAIEVVALRLHSLEITARRTHAERHSSCCGLSSNTADRGLGSQRLRSRGFAPGLRCSDCWENCTRRRGAYSPGGWMWLSMALDGTPPPN